MVPKLFTSRGQTVLVYTFLVEVANPFETIARICRHKVASGKMLTWSWAYSTGHPTSDQCLEAAAKAAWPYALLCTWTYLNDHAAAHDLMDHAVQNAFDYLGRHIGCSDQKRLSRIKSAIKRRARQQSAKKNREIPSGSLQDLERMCVDPADAEQRIYANDCRHASRHLRRL